MNYHVVIDLEMCKVPRANRTESYKWQQETIQIGAILLNDKYEQIDSFNTMVSPEYGYIDPFIKNLTGIGFQDVMGAPRLDEALKMFTEWIPEGNVEMVSWSDTDEIQFRREMTGKNIDNARMMDLLDNWNDCQVRFSEIMNSNRRYSLREALIAADILQEGKEHDGLADAYNTALLFSKMETEDDFKLNDIYESARVEEVEHLSCSLGDLFGGLNFCFAS